MKKINWDFSDFKSTKYPYDLNSIPWYPASFISPIPRVLVSALSKPGDVVLDPFGGKGTTAIETLLQNRIPIYCDLNPFISESVHGLFSAIEYELNNNLELRNEREMLSSSHISDEKARYILQKYNVDPAVYMWFHENTVHMLLNIVELVHTTDNSRVKNIRKLAFSSILKMASSQTEHFTYVTDNCKPKILKEKNANQMYVERVEQILRAAREFLVHFRNSFPAEDINSIINKRQIVTGNAKDLSWISDNSVNLVITSPPYLCSQDYIKTMRLMNLFFDNKQAFEVDVKQEIGARSSRRGKSEVVVNRFYSDLRSVFDNIKRVLKRDGFFALIIGQGKSTITKAYDIVTDLKRILIEEYGFQMVYCTERQIGNRVIQVGGVDMENVLIFVNKGE